MLHQFLIAVAPRVRVIGIDVHYTHPNGVEHLPETHKDRLRRNPAMHRCTVYGER